MMCKLLLAEGIFQSKEREDAMSFLSDAVGEYVIVRSSNEGLNAGKLIAADSTGCALKNARRLWFAKPADSSQAWYEGVANSGLHSDSKVSPPVKKKYIVEAYSITVCTKAAASSIKSAISHGS